MGKEFQMTASATALAQTDSTEELDTSIFIPD
jgi:hypothetical protein